MARRAGAYPAAEAARSARIIDALVAVVDEVGFEAASVTAICARAKVSRDTFYATFEGRQDCFLAMMDDGLASVSELIERSFAAHDHWLEGVRTAFAELLTFFEAEPRRARVWLIQTLGAGAWALERRERHLAALTAAILARWPPPSAAATHPFVAEAVMSSVLGIIQRHLMSGRPEPLISLLGPLMGVACAPYTERRVAREQVERCQPLVVRAATHKACSRQTAVELPPGLRHPRAHRLRGCLAYVTAHPGASNREIAAAIGIASHTQASALLARLASMGLLDKRPGLPGRPNAWSASERGRQATRTLERELTVAPVTPIEGHTSHTIPTAAAACVTS